MQVAGDNHPRNTHYALLNKFLTASAGSAISALK
jgi:hypothetical protein